MGQVKNPTLGYPFLSFGISFGATSAHVTTQLMLNVSFIPPPVNHSLLYSSLTELHPSYIIAIP